MLLRLVIHLGSMLDSVHHTLTLVLLLQVSLHFLLGHVSQLASQFLKLRKHSLARLVSCLTFLLFKGLVCTGKEFLLLLGIISLHIKWYGIVLPVASDTHVDAALVKVYPCVLQLLQVLHGLLALLHHYRICVDNAVGHFHVAQILEEVLYLVVVTAQVPFLYAASLGTHSLVAYFVHYYHTADNISTCLFEHDVGQLYLRTHYGGLLALNPFLKLLVCRTSWNKGHNTTAFLQVLECLTQVSNGCRSCRTKRWVHYYYVVLVADVVVLEYGVLELPAQSSCLQL